MATQILTGHAALNYHISKDNRTVEPICPLCEAEEETVSHLLGQCQMLGKLKAELLHFRHLLYHSKAYCRQI